MKGDKRLRVAVVCLALGLAIVPGSEARPDIVPGGAFDRSLVLAANGRLIEAGGAHRCAEGERWRIDVVITQEDAVAEGHADGMCSGDVGTWKALAVARGSASFEPGRALGCATEITRDGGEQTGRFTWCDKLVLHFED